MADDCIDIDVGIGDNTDLEWAGVKMATADSPDCGHKPREARTRVINSEKFKFSFNLILCTQFKGHFIFSWLSWKGDYFETVL